MAQDKGSNEVKLLSSWPSPYGSRTRTALHLKGVTYEYLEEKDVLNSKSELLLKYNPIHKKVPVLVHGDRPICESLNIVEYIDEVWSTGPSILPSDPYDRANARFWAQFIDGQCFAAIDALAGAKDDEERKARAGKLAECLGLLEEAHQKLGKGKDFFGGDEIGLVDIACGSILGPLGVIERFSGIKFLQTPGLVRWSEKFSAHEAVKPYSPSVDDFVALAKKKFNLP